MTRKIEIPCDDPKKDAEAYADYLFEVVKKQSLVINNSQQSVVSDNDDDVIAVFKQDRAIKKNPCKM
jgi:hypothetical protein